MLFNSVAFLFWFLPIVTTVYHTVPTHMRIGILLVASYIFYGWWNPLFCLLMLLSTTIDFVAGKHIYRTTDARTKKLFLILSLSCNLSILGFFKYYGMLSTTVNTLADTPILPILQIVLPIGISFYTFQSMSYSIDIYRGVSRPTKRFTDFACYVALFPQLVAGPIVRYADISDQFIQRIHSYDKIAEGLYRFVIGLAKKVLIADAMAVVANAAFATSSPDGTVAWLGLFAYTFQIYFDFSGYSDMAIGLGLMFGFRFPENFRMPYHAKSITEFWQRWHMTMSNWFRDYVYIPLGGNRKGKLFTLRNLLLTMILAGFWHGAAWTFVAWGLVHGLLLVTERIGWKQIEKIPSQLRVASTFIMVMLAWVLFRAETFESASAYYRALFTGGISTPNLYALFAVLTGILLVILEPFVPNKPKSFSTMLALGLCALFGICLVTIFGNTDSPFIYFQF